jgi:5'-phosphate synthase pdxT subunit
MVFIRGPIIERTGPGIEILAKHAGKPAIVQKGRLLATTFHPELTADTTVHEYFLKLARESAHGFEKTNGAKPRAAKSERSNRELTTAKSST